MADPTVHINIRAKPNSIILTKLRGSFARLYALPQYFYPKPATSSMNTGHLLRPILQHLHSLGVAVASECSLARILTHCAVNTFLCTRWSNDEKRVQEGMSTSFSSSKRRNQVRLRRICHSLVPHARSPTRRRSLTISPPPRHPRTEALRSSMVGVGPADQNDARTHNTLQLCDRLRSVFSAESRIERGQNTHERTG